MRHLPRPAHALIAALTCMSLTACGAGNDADADAGSDADTNPGDDSGESAVTSGADLVAATGTIKILVGDATTPYTIMIPEGFALKGEDGDTSARFDDPDADFGERTADIELRYLPTPYTAQELVDNFKEINADIVVLEQADDGAVSYYTYTTPSVSNEGEIAFGNATTSYTLADGTALQCRAGTQHAIDEEWSEADAAAVANQMLEICLTALPG